MQRLANIAGMRHLRETGKLDPFIARGAAGSGAEELESNAAVGHRMPKRPDQRGLARIDMHRRSAEERRVAVREMEQGGHQLPRLAAHQHASFSVDYEVERDAQLMREDSRLPTRQLLGASGRPCRAVACKR